MTSDIRCIKEKDMVHLEFNSVLQLITKFPTQQTCIDYLEEMRGYNDHYTVISPFRKDALVVQCADAQKLVIETGECYTMKRYKCMTTGKYFNAFTFTMFHGTRIPLQKWFLAIWLWTSHKPGVSALQMARDINVGDKTALKMHHKVQLHFPQENTLEGKVEIDGSHFGGKDTNRQKNKRKGKKDVKTAVLGMLQRGGKVIATVIGKEMEQIVTPIIMDIVDTTSDIFTDRSWAWNSLRYLGYNHESVSHSQEEYVRGECHTNSLEGFWSLCKRGMSGVHHSVSKKYLQHYINETAFKYNTKDYTDRQRFDYFLQNI